MLVPDATELFDTDYVEEFATLEYTLKIKCTTNKSQPKDSFRAEDLYENHSGMYHQKKKSYNSSKDFFSSHTI